MNDSFFYHTRIAPDTYYVEEWKNRQFIISYEITFDEYVHNTTTEECEQLFNKKEFENKCKELGL